MFVRRAGSDEALVVVEGSDDLSHWSPLPRAQLVLVSAPAGGLVSETWVSSPGPGRAYVRARAASRQ